MDRAEILSLPGVLETPAGSFRNCLRTRESSALESDSELALVKIDKLTRTIHELSG